MQECSREKCWSQKVLYTVPNVEPGGEWTRFPGTWVESQTGRGRVWHKDGGKPRGNKEKIEEASGKENDWQRTWKKSQNKRCRESFAVSFHLKVIGFSGTLDKSGLGAYLWKRREIVCVEIPEKRRMHLERWYWGWCEQCCWSGAEMQLQSI